jgi:prepilin-type N-terminal cleavage/methylation domain-containing protein
MNRSGVSLLELLAAMTLGALLATVLGGALVAQLRLGRFAAERAASADALRTATAILGGEIRRTTAADVRAIAADSVALRAFRGVARLCSSDFERITVLYRGDRLPDSRKDSLLMIDGSRREHRVAILDVRHHTVGCAAAPGEVGLLLRLSQAVPPGVGLAFESGSYYVSSRAVRYRLGAEGRQPLTAELFVAGSGFAPGPAGVRFALQTLRGDAASGTAWFSP